MGQPTRERVARSILEQGPSTAAALAARLDLTPAAVRRHLDHLVAEGAVEARDPAPRRRSPRPGPSCQGLRDHRHRSRPLRPGLRRPGRASAQVPGRDRVATMRSGRSRTDGCRSSRSGSPTRTPTTRSSHPPRRSPGCSPTRATSPRCASCRSSAASTWASSCASSTARWPMSPTSSPSCARPRPRRSAGCSAATCNGWPPSPTATGCAPPASRRPEK